MKFPLWILMALIVVSLVFAGVMTYNLYQAQVLARPPPETLIDVVDAIPSSPVLPATPKALSSSPPSEKQVDKPLVNKYEKAVVKKEPEQNTVKTELSPVPVIQKIGSISVKAGEVTAVSVVR